MTDKDRRSGWLRDLKPGDKVATVRSGLSSKFYTIYTVTRITPAGRIVCEAHGFQTVFSPDGYGPHVGSWSVREHLQPYTDELEGEIIHQRLVSEVGMFLDFGQVDRDMLNRLGARELQELLDRLEPLKKEVR